MVRKTTERMLHYLLWRSSVVVADVTPTLDGLTSTPRSVDRNASATDELSRMAKQRVILLAAKYAGGNETSEIVARLEILNRRLLERAPRISKDQVAALENASDTLTRIRASRVERASRLGISS